MSAELSKRRKDLMIHGFSHPEGILFMDAKAEDEASVYAVRKDGEIEVSEGPREEMKALWDKDRDALSKENWELKFMAAELALLVLGLILLIRVHPGVFGYLGYAVFIALSAKPLLSLMMLGYDSYITKGHFEKMKRTHGAEHTLVDYVMRTPDDRDWDMETIRKCSHIADNCGGVAAAERFLMGLFPALAVGLIPHIGILRAVLVFLIGEAVVFAGSFAGHPLLKWFQVPNVSKPGEEELELAREGIRRLVERKTDQG